MSAGVQYVRQYVPTLQGYDCGTFFHQVAWLGPDARWVEGKMRRVMYLPTRQHSKNTKLAARRYGVRTTVLLYLLLTQVSGVLSRSEDDALDGAYKVSRTPSSLL